MYQKLLDLSKDIPQFQIKKPLEIYSLLLLEGDESLEITTDFVHTLAEVDSQILIKAVLTDKAQLDIFANLVVEKSAKQIDSYLRIEVLLLNSGATANVVPALEVNCTDVKAGHGANVRTILPEEKFYLQARGLSEQQAENLLTAGFLNDFWTKLNSKNKQQLKTIYSNTNLFNYISSLD